VPVSHPPLRDWPDPSAPVSVAAFDKQALQAAIDNAIAVGGGWDARIVVTQVNWITGPIPDDFAPVVGSVDIDADTLVWFGASAYDAGTGAWRYGGLDYSSYAAAVAAGASGGDSVVEDGLEWEVFWNTGLPQPCWDIIIDVPESLIMAYLDNPSADALFVGSRKQDGYVKVYGHDQWIGQADLRVNIRSQSPDTAPTLVSASEQIAVDAYLTDPICDPQTVVVDNGGVGSLSWTAAEAPDQTWMTLQDASGTDGQAFQIAIDVSGLSTGSHSGAVEVSDPNAGNNPLTIPVTVTVYNDLVGSTNLVAGSTLVNKPDAVWGYVDVATSQTGPLEVTVEWVDGYGRVADRHVATIVVPDQTHVDFAFATDVGLTMVNALRASARFVGTQDVLAGSTVSWQLVPEAMDRQDYHASIYGQGGTSNPEYFAAIRQGGVDLGQIYRDRAYYGHEYNVRPAHGWIEDQKWFFLSDDLWSADRQLYSDALKVYGDYNTPAKRVALVRPQSLSSSASLAALVDTIVPRMQATAKWRPLHWIMADEYGLGQRGDPFDYDLGPECMSGFVAWLQEQYGSIEALNAQWETSFGTWADLSDPINAPPGGEAALIVCQEIRDREFPLTDWGHAKNFSPWSDFRRHMEETMADAMQVCVDAGSEIDSDCPVGWMSGMSLSPMNGYDYWLQTRVAGSLSAYDIGNSPEYVRAFRDNASGERLFHWNYVHWTDQESWDSGPRNRYKLWFHLIHYGTRTCQIWDNGYYFDDMYECRLSPFAIGLASTLEEFRGGLAKLLSQGERDDDEIALYYSQRSTHISWLHDSESGRHWISRTGNWEPNHSSLLFTHTGWLKALEDIGLKGRFLSYEQIAGGELITNGYKVLIMPRVMALGDEEIAAVQAFADAGGLVVADTQTAIYDGHCRRRSVGEGGGLMDDWFGIEREFYFCLEQDGESYDALGGDVYLQPLPPGFDVLTEGLADPIPQFEGWHAVETHTHTAGGTPAALFDDDPDRPALIVREHGLGKSVYMNLTLHRYGTSYDDPNNDPSNYTEDRRTPSSLAAANVRQLVSNLMALGGVTPKVNVLQGHNASDPPAGTEVYNLEKARYVDGDIVYLSCVVNSFLSHYDWSGQNPATTLFGQPGVTNADVTLVLDEAAHVYDVRQQLYLGYGTRINASQPVLEGGVFALLPYQVTALNVDSIGFDGKQRASLTVSVQTNAGAPGRHVLRLEVFDPNSDPMDHLTRNLVAPDGLFSGVIPFAVDEDLVGGLIRLTDVATGAQVDINITADLLEPALLASEPPADGTLPKTQNNLMWLTFSGSIALPGGPALGVVPLGVGADVGTSFDYSVEPDGVTLKAVEQGAVLTNQTWYQVTPAVGLNVQPFTLDVCTLIGDCNGSGRLTTADYSCVKAAMGQRGDVREDLNGSARVTTADYSAVKSHLGDRAPVKP